MSDKKSRKELLKEEDAFIHAAAQSATWMKHHGTLVAAGIVVLVVAVLGVWGGIEYTGSRDGDASRLYLSALKLGDAEVVTGEGKTADPKATPPTFASEKERNEAARSAFASVVETAPGSHISDLASFYVADLDAKLSNLDSALAGYKKLQSSLSAEDSLYFLAVERAAYLEEQKGDGAAAMKSWEQLTGSSKKFYADYALYHLARLHADKGEKDRARELLLRLQKEFTTTSLKQEIEQLLAQVGGVDLTMSAQGDAQAKAKP